MLTKVWIACLKKVSGYIMKKEVPHTVKVDIPYDRDILENLFMQRFDNMIKNGYPFAIHDYHLFCAILIRLYPLEKLPQIIKDSIIQNGKLRPEILFQKITLAIEKCEQIEKDELDFYFKTRYEEAKRRKEIVKKEIQRTGISFSKVNISNSVYFRELLCIIKEFSDLTLMDWFVPVVLTFERYVHICVKHVEETKICDGQFKKRSFFDYKHTEILTLIRRIIRSQEKDIKEHFCKNHIENETNQKSMLKSYHRGVRGVPPILFGQDSFALSISKYGFIETFYQIK